MRTRASGPEGGLLKPTNNPVGGQVMLRILRTVLVLEMAAPLTALPPTPVTLHPAPPISV
ncbi:MAG: hypothetical protein ACKV19_26570 [Verrucomicrobiales bacterium]